MAAWILTLVIFSPLAGALLLLLPPREDRASIRLGALFSTAITFVLTLAALVIYCREVQAGVGLEGGYHLTACMNWVGLGATESIDIAYRVGVDGISIALLLLTSFLMPLVMWSSFSSIKDRCREYYILLLLLQVAMSGAFCANDLLLFYVFFEFTLVPLYFLIGIWGGPQKRRAANKFFIFTVTGSVLTFAGVLYLGYFAWARGDGVLTLSFTALTEMGRSGQIPYDVQWWIFLAFAAGFAIKVPLFPVHTWLPLAHTEAPTAGSVVLAGVLLKLGTYGFCRLSIPILPDAAYQLAPIIAVLAIIGIIYAALAAWVQDDVKKLVAYSSVSHLGFCMLGLFSLKVVGVSGAVLYMVNHGLSTGALFLVIGFMYERYHTRDINRIGGLARRMPWFAFFLVFFTLSSIGLPGLNGFVGEFTVLLGTAVSRTVGDGMRMGPLGFGYVVPAALGIILGAVYMLWMCQRVLFGPLREPPNSPDTSAVRSVDLNRREIAILVPIALVCIWLGVYPKPVLRGFEPAIKHNVLGAYKKIPETDAVMETSALPADSAFELNSEPVTLLLDVTDTVAFDAPQATGGAADVP